VRTERQGKGARIAHGGKRALAETGLYVEPTILDGASNRMRIAQDGLAAAEWTRDMGAAHRLSRAIRAGTVWVNTYDRSSLATPFGGFKQSGFGRDRSPHAIDKSMDFKAIWTHYR
jgi:4-(gamma-glutamylamino)butanal dehydrogenase